MSVIQVRGLYKTYRDGFFLQKRVDALKGISLEVRPGEIFGLLGPNGAGKTTLIKILLGIVRRTRGEAMLLGHSAGDRRSRQRVGYLPEGHRLPRHLTGNTALEYYGGLSGLSGGEVRRRREKLLQRVGLAKWGKTSVRKYSKGMLQRLGLAQAMLHDPELLILDEPTDGVDPRGRAEIRNVLKEWKDSGRTVFLNSHLLQELELVCDRLAILDHGTVRMMGDLREIKEKVGQEQANQTAFSLRGEKTRIQECLKPFQVLNPKVEGDHCTVTVVTPSQAVRDQCIDALRAAGISIENVVPKTITLEEAFMKLIKHEDE